MVSVPSRGAIFLNNIDWTMFDKIDIVSVPSRGAIFLNDSRR